MGIDIVGESIEHAGNTFQGYIHKWSKDKGFWRDDEYYGDQMFHAEYITVKLALVITELAEAIESVRKHGLINTPDEHLPEYSNIDVELADALIRLFDLAEYLECPLMKVAIAKMKYNHTRPHKHGKLF